MTTAQKRIAGLVVALAVVGGGYVLLPAPQAPGHRFGTSIGPRPGGGGSGTVSSVSGTAPIAVATGTTTPVVSIAASTSSVPGSMAATDKAFIDVSAWERSAIAFMQAKIPQLTGFKQIVAGSQPIGAANATPTGDPLVEGGGVGNTAGVVRAMTGMVFQTPKTGKLAIYGRVLLPAPVTAKQTMFGAINAGGTHQFVVMSSFDTAVTNSHTNFVWQIAPGGANVNGATTAAADGAYHDICITTDGTSYHAYIDQGSDIIVDPTKAATSNVNSDEPYQVMVYGTDAIAAKVSIVLIGFIAP